MLALPVLYFVLKYAAYVAWCYFGLKKFGPQGENQRNRAYLYGFYRLLLGFGFGLVIFFAVQMFSSAFGSSITGTLLTYVCAYLPVRWVEWSIMSVMISPEPYTVFHFFSGLHHWDRLWRMGGIGVSFLADLPILIAIGGFPVGRFLC
jgi:hypothetical protein